MSLVFSADKNIHVIEKTYVSFDKAISKLDEMIMTYEDIINEAGIRLVNGKWQIWVKIDVE